MRPSTHSSVTVGTGIAAVGTIAADHTDLDATSSYLLPAPSPGAARGTGSHGPLGPGGFASFGLRRERATPRRGSRPLPGRPGEAAPTVGSVGAELTTPTEPNASPFAKIL